MAGKRRQTWTIINDERYATEEAFRDAVREELAQAEHVGYRHGFGVVAGPIRQRTESGEIITLGWEFRAERIPLLGGPLQQAGPLPDAPEPEPVEPDEDMIAMVGPGGEERMVPESEVADLMEDGWLPDQDSDDPEEPDREPVAVTTSDPYAKEQ